MKTFTIITLDEKNGCSYLFCVNAGHSKSAISKLRKVEKTGNLGPQKVIMILDGDVKASEKQIDAPYGFSYIINI